MGEGVGGGRGRGGMEAVAQRDKETNGEKGWERERGEGGRQKKGGRERGDIKSE